MQSSSSSNLFEFYNSLSPLFSQDVINDLFPEVNESLAVKESKPFLEVGTKTHAVFSCSLPLFSEPLVSSPVKVEEKVSHPSPLTSEVSIKPKRGRKRKFPSNPSQEEKKHLSVSSSYDLKKKEIEKRQEQQQNTLKLSSEVEAVVDQYRKAFPLTVLPSIERIREKLPFASDLSNDQMVEIYQKRIQQVVETLAWESIILKDEKQETEGRLSLAEGRISQLERENGELKSRLQTQNFYFGNIVAKFA